MAFTPQPYENLFKNRNHNYNGNNNINNARRVQFSISTNNNGTNRSLPNLHQLANQESLPYRPHSPPTLTHEMESIEIHNNKIVTNSNHSSPESNDSNHSDLHSDIKAINTKLPLNKASNYSPMRASIVLNRRIKLVNEESHKIDDTHNKEYDYKVYRQVTMSNASYYDYNHNEVSEVHEEEYMAPPPYTLPITTSIPLEEDRSINDDEMKTFSQAKQSLISHFSNDMMAFSTWIRCSDVNDDTFGYYSALYPILCEIFAENTKCSRVPKQSDLEEVLLKHGATKIKISKFIQMSNLSGTINSDIIHLYNTPPATPPSCTHMATVSAQYSGTISFDFDNPLCKPEYIVTIKYAAFFSFWKWFRECCKIIKELAHLWEANNQSTLQCNLFCGREESESILDQAPQGTFMLRLSSVIKGGIVLSYTEPSFSKKEKQFKHTILIRRQQNQYELRSHARQRHANKTNKKQLTTISSLIRSFVKIKFLYTPHNLYPKKVIF